MGARGRGAAGTAAAGPQCNSGLLWCAGARTLVQCGAPAVPAAEGPGQVAGAISPLHTHAQWPTLYEGISPEQHALPSQVSDLAEGIWAAWGAAGPPYFKKVRQRAALDRLEQVWRGAACVSACVRVCMRVRGVSSCVCLGLGHALGTAVSIVGRGTRLQGTGTEAVDDLLGELLSQNWRVELDAGLGGANLSPQEHILVVCTRWVVLPSMGGCYSTVQYGWVVLP